MSTAQMARTEGGGSAVIGNVHLLTKLRQATGDEGSHQEGAANHDTYIARLREDTGQMHSSDGDGDAATFVVARLYPLELLAADERLRLRLERHQLVLRAANHRHILRAWPAMYTSTDLVTIEEFCEFGEVFEVVEKNNEDAQMRGVERTSNTNSVLTAAPEPDRFSVDGLPTAVVLRLFDELLQAVAYCHDVLGVCHRDIKLEHLLLDRSMCLKLANFGMSAALPGMHTAGPSVTAVDPMLQVACGSRHYVAPEILAGAPYDGAAADVWSCGVVLYALVTGGFPTDSAAEDVVVERREDMIEPSRISYEGIRDTTVKDVLRGMLQADPPRRWTVTQVQQQWSRLRRARKLSAV